MTSFNSVSISTGVAKFVAKYPVTERKPNDAPLAGYFNYIHLIDALKTLSSDTVDVSKFQNMVIDQFHQQGILSAKMKLITPFSSDSVASSGRGQSGMLKLHFNLDDVSIQHSTFGPDGIAKGDGNSVEPLNLSIRLNIDGSVNDSQRADIEALLGSDSAVSASLRACIRDALANQQPLEIAIERAKLLLGPHLEEAIGSGFDLKIKLKRDQLFDGIKVVIGRSDFRQENRPLSNSEDIVTWGGADLTQLRSYSKLPSHIGSFNL
ncbi:hypothetical protein NQT62_00410 [Limnobacter humi]|uniref:Uncharacterized protein n=1 Tax=Limnobacter humi TaxID=1778671 RepID=A0ABT1WC02_9BURK|nr:hypothetical protein [Limnobacter humi]MCQ8894899.1 hypothetical protein [Limnobacter humi]